MATTHYVTKHVPMTTRDVVMTTRHVPMTTRCYPRTHRHLGTLTLIVVCLLLVLIPSTRGRTVSAGNKTSPAENQLHPGHANVTSEPPGGGHDNNTAGHGGHDAGRGGHDAGRGGHDADTHHEKGDGIIVAGWNWHHVHQPFVITLVLIAAAILKLGFHHAGRLPQFVPESCVLIILGVIVGGILYATGSPLFAKLQPSFFFLILLPPIILESSYSLYDRVFFDNLGTILLYAVVGTILNCFLLGPALYGLAQAGAMGPITISLIQCLVFASLIVAVDPVAVLAIFQEIGVNNVLYFLVFGESLLNDAVTVVLYNMMKAFNNMKDGIPAIEIFKAVCSFFTISLVGMFIGILFGIMTALFTKYTAKVRVVEPLAVFTLAYASYLTADLFMFSGIISIFACGLTQAHFSFHNVSHKSCTTILYFSKIMSTTSDCIIFMFLGLALWNTKHKWHTGFVLWTVLLCLVFRFIVVYFLTYLANKMKRIRKIDYEEQFIMAYGGLRGAVAFSLVAMLDKKSLDEGMMTMFETTTLVVVLFTVFVQGMTIKPLVKLLRIRKEGEKVVSLCDEITNHVTDHVMAGIEEVIGYSGRNRIREMLDYYDDKYLKRILQRSPMTKDEHIMELYKEIAIQDHYDSLASNVDMCRYSSQMVLYHSGKADEEDDAFIAMAQTNPELADLALDTQLHRRNTVSRGYYYPTNRQRAKTTPSRMFSDPGPDYPSRTVHDMEAVGFPRKTTSVDSEPASSRDVTIQELRRMLVKPATEVLHQKHDRNILQDAQPDLVHLLHEKQLRTTRYLRSISMSMTPESGSPLNASPTDPNKRFVFPRQRSHTAYPAPRLYRRSYTGGGRVRHDSDGPVMAYRSRTHSESTSPSMSVPMKYRSSSLGAVNNPGNATPPLAPIAERNSNNGGHDNNNDEPRRRKHAASVSSAASTEDDNGVGRGRRLLSRQDKVRDISPSKKMDSRDASPAKLLTTSRDNSPHNMAAGSRDVTDSKMAATSCDVTDTVMLPEVQVTAGAEEEEVQNTAL